MGKNKANIARGIKNMHTIIYQTMISGLSDACNDAVKIALSTHESGENHLQGKGAYGYGIFYNGELIRKKVWGKSKQSTISAIENFPTPSNGYCAVIMAGMDPAYMFNPEHESDILINSMSVTRSNFTQYFLRYEK